MKKLLILIILSLPVLFGCVRKDTLEEESGFTGWAVGDVADGYGSILKTTDDGFHWIRQGSISIVPGVNLYDISATNDKEVWVVGDSLSFPVVSGFDHISADTLPYGLILFSEDGGYHWSRMIDTTLLRDIGLRSVNARSSKIWIAGEKGTVIYSANKGMTWTRPLPDTMPQVTFNALTVKGQSRIWIAGNRYDSTGTFLQPVLIISMDGGVTWLVTTSFSTYPIHDIFALNDTTVYMVSGTSILRSFDAGLTWIEVYNAGALQILSISCDSTSTWASGGGGMFYTITKGIWKVIHPYAMDFTFHRITMSQGTRVWAIGSCSDPTRKAVIIYSRNAGQSWYIQNSPVNTVLRSSSFVSGTR